jgi:WD40 repeat protein
MRRILVTTSWDSTVKLWDYRAQALVRTYKEHTDSVMACAFQPSQGRFFVTVGCDARVVLHVAQEQSQALVPVEKNT